MVNYFPHVQLNLMPTFVNISQIYRPKHTLDLEIWSHIYLFFSFNDRERVPCRASIPKPCKSISALVPISVRVVLLVFCPVRRRCKSTLTNIRGNVTTDTRVSICMPYSSLASHKLHKVRCESRLTTSECLSRIFSSRPGTFFGSSIPAVMPAIPAPTTIAFKGRV